MATDGPRHCDAQVDELRVHAACADHRLDRVVTARRLGITSPLPQVPSMALGSLRSGRSTWVPRSPRSPPTGSTRKPYLVDAVADRDGRRSSSTSPDASSGVVADGAVRERHPDGRHHERYGDTCPIRRPPAGRGKDGHDVGLRGRVVRRLHAAACRPRCGWARRSGRRTRCGTSVASGSPVAHAGAHLAGLHGPRASGTMICLGSSRPGGAQGGLPAHRRRARPSTHPTARRRRRHRRPGRRRHGTDPGGRRGKTPKSGEG